MYGNTKTFTKILFHHKKQPSNKGATQRGVQEKKEEDERVTCVHIYVQGRLWLVYSAACVFCACRCSATRFVTTRGEVRGGVPASRPTN